jgi:hypothetical protein
MTLEQVLADVRGAAAVLRANGHKAQADSMDAVVDRVRDCMGPYLDWLTEDEARTRSGWSITRLRAAFPEWETLGLSRWHGEGRRAARQYRRLIVPRRANLEAARAAALREATKAA